MMIFLLLVKLLFIAQTYNFGVSPEYSSKP